MKTLPASLEMPQGVVLEQPPFVPRMVMTNELKSVVKNVLHQWRHREAFKGLVKYGIRPLDRLLFHGPPGNGKTMACYWIARELDVPLFRVECNQLIGGHFGDTTKAIANAAGFMNARRDPAICLWDEVEAIFIDRKEVGQACDRERAAALTVFTQQLDRWRAPTLMVLATNLPQQLDAALLSRVEMKLEFTGPTLDQCENLIAYWAELLHDHGGGEWGLTLAEQARDTLPASFRELQQQIAWSAREWVARRCD